MKSAIFIPLCAAILASGSPVFQEQFLSAYGELVDLVASDPTQARHLSSLLQAPFRLPAPANSSLEPVQEALTTLHKVLQEDFEGSRELHQAILKAIQLRLENQRVNRDRHEQERKKREIVDLAPVALTSFHSLPAKNHVFSPDGTEILVSKFDELEVWNIETRKCVQTFAVQHLREALFLPGGQEILLFLNLNPNGSLIDVLDRKTLVRRRLEHAGLGYAVNPVIQDSLLAFADRFGNKAVVLDWRTDTLIETYGPEARWGWSLAWRPGAQNELAYGLEHRTPVYLVQITGNPDLTKLSEKRLIGHDHSIFSLEFSPDGTTLASGSLDKTVILWNLEQESPREAIGGFLEKVDQVIFSRDAKHLIALGGNLHVFNLESSPPTEVFRRRYSSYSLAALSPDGKTLAVFNGSTKQVELWDFSAILAEEE